MTISMVSMLPILVGTIHLPLSPLAIGWFLIHLVCFYMLIKGILVSLRASERDYIDSGESMFIDYGRA